MCEIQSDEIDSALYDFLCEKGFVIQTSRQDVCKTYESEFFVDKTLLQDPGDIWTYDHSGLVILQIFN